MTTDVVVPYRSDGPERDAALKWVRRRWELAGYRVVIGDGGAGPWVKAHAVADALERSTADVVVIADADVWTEHGPAVEEVERGAAWAVPHRTVRRLSRPDTARVLAGAEPDASMLVERRPYVGHAGGGMVVLRREVYEAVPMDPRFVGWGQEDDAWALALRNLAGRAWRGDADLFHLWHPEQPRSGPTIGSEASWALYRRYTAASGHRGRMRALVDEYATGRSVT